MKKKRDLFIWDGKYIEGDSLFEIRQEMSDVEWSKLVKETIDFYCFMKAAESLGPAKMDHNDARLCKRLRRSIELFKKIDPRLMEGFSLEKYSADKMENMKKEWEQVEQTIRIAHDKKAGKISSDIIVSDI